MTGAVLSVGNEVVIGQIADTNAAWLSQELAALGIEVVEHMAVGDYHDRIKRAAKELAERVDFIVVTGGIGPTADDLTRQSLADLAGLRLVLDPEALDNIRSLFAFRNMPMPEQNRIQAMIPEGAVIVPNAQGTAAGFRLKIGRAEVASLPGVPYEMKGMFKTHLAPYLRAVTGEAVVIVRNLRTFGTGESVIGQKIEHLMGLNENPLVGTLAQDGIVTVKLTVKASNRDEATRMLDARERQVRELLGEIVFGVDVPGLEFVVAEELARRGWTIATAESCTGGMIAGRLTSVPGISRSFTEGVVCYSNESKTRHLGVPRELIDEHGAVSSPVAEAMATGARRGAGTDIAVSATGIAGPTGGTPERPVGLVFIAVADARGVRVTEHRFRGERDIIRDRAAKTALNLVRLRLLE